MFFDEKVKEIGGHKGACLKNLSFSLSLVVVEDNDDNNL